MKHSHSCLFFNFPEIVLWNSMKCTLQLNQSNFLYKLKTISTNCLTNIFITFSLLWSDRVLNFKRTIIFSSPEKYIKLLCSSYFFSALNAIFENKRSFRIQAVPIFFNSLMKRKVSPYPEKKISLFNQLKKIVIPHVYKGA